MRQPTGFRFLDLLDPSFFKRRPGRPRVPSWGEIWIKGKPPTWDDIYGADAWRGPLPQRGGRPPDQKHNQSLLEGYHAKPQGMTTRAFAKKWYCERYGRDPTPENVGTVERQIARLLKK
jgi:hypothetical protein